MTAATYQLGLAERFFDLCYSLRESDYKLSMRYQWAAEYLIRRVRRIEACPV